MNYDAILRGVPVWAIPIALISGLWFGLHYLYISPLFYERLTLQARTDYATDLYDHSIGYYNENNKQKNDLKYTNCIYAQFQKQHRLEIAYWTASFSFYRDKKLEGMSRFLQEIVKSDDTLCGVPSWKK